MKTAVVRNIYTNELYHHLGGNRFKNIRTGASGEIPDEAAEKFLKINVPLTVIINDFPLVGEMINRLNLSYDPH